MRFLFIGLFLTCIISSFGQIPNHSKTIIVKGVSFLQVCNALLDSGYAIEKKDNELQTAATEAKQYPKLWNATYKINIRVKDSVAYLSGTFTGANGGLFKGEPVEYLTNKKGQVQSKHLFTYPFLLINYFAKGFNKQIEYR